MDNDDTENPHHMDNVIYTPASSTSHDDGTTTSDDAGSWWRADGGSGLAQLSKQLDVLKEMLAKQGLEEEANDLSRLKQNHRSSLASLAELHRTEMAGLKMEHDKVIRKLELLHMEELKEARRNNGHDRDLIKGLHESYGKQVESLVMDLGEVRREVKELSLRGGEVEAAQQGILELGIRFEGLDFPLQGGQTGLCERQFVVPHPGRSWERLLATLECLVRNHAATLETTANFFVSNPTQNVHYPASVSIKYWCESVEANRVKYELPWPREEWENGLWKESFYVPGVVCKAEGQEELSFEQLPEDDGATVVEEKSLEVEPVEPLVQVSDSDMNDDLERINRALDEIHLHEQLPSDPESEGLAPILQDSEEDKENYEPTAPPPPPLPINTRKVTVEEVRDEDDPPLPDAETMKKVIPILKSPRPPIARSHPVIWEDGQNRQFATEYLQNELKKNEDLSSRPKPTDSWLYNTDIFDSPLPEEKGNDKETDVFSQTTDGSSHLSDKVGTEPSFAKELGEVLSKPPSYVEPLIGTDEEVTPSGSQQWMMPGPAGFQRAQTWATGYTLPPAVRHPVADVNSFLDRNQEDSVLSEHIRAIENPNHALFNIPETPESMIPPEAPELTGRESPIPLPDIDEENEENQPPEVEDTTGDENPFNPPRDRPIGDAAHSIGSTTPLLQDDSTSRRSRPSSIRHSFNRADSLRNRGERPPLAPCASTTNGSPQRNGSPRSNAARREGYHRTSGDESGKDLNDHWENRSQSDASSIGGYEDGDAYLPRNYAEREYTHGPASPAPTQSSFSQTTTDDPGYAPQVFGSSTGSNLGPSSFRYPLSRPMVMGPLNPPPRMSTFPGAHMPFSPQQHFNMMFQEMNQRIQDQFFAGPGLIPPRMVMSPRASTAPSYIGGGPVYAPNPPHSIVTRNNSIAMPSPPYASQNGVSIGPNSLIGSNVNIGQGSFQSVPEYLNYPAPPPLHMLNRTAEPARTFSPVDSLWSPADMMGMPVPPPQPQRTSPVGEHTQAGFMTGMPWQMGMQPSTPAGSQVGMRPMPPSWYQQQQQQQQVQQEWPGAQWSPYGS